METQSKKNSGNQLMLAIIIIAVIAVIAIAVTKKPEKTEPPKGQIPLSEEKLIACWHREEKEKEYRYDIVFEQGNGFIYSRFTGDEISPSLVSIHGKFSIEGNVIAVSFELDGEALSEKYSAVLTEENKLTLSPIENGGKTLVGTYVKEGEGEIESEKKDTSENAEVKDEPDDESSSPSDCGASSEPTGNEGGNQSDGGAATDSKPSEQDRDSSWKKAYLDYINQAYYEGFISYNLIYVDDNDVPELYLCGAGEYIGEKICTYTNGVIVELPLYRLCGTSFKERSGLIMNSNGHMGYYSDSLYKLENGVFTRLHYGTIEEVETSTSYVYVYTVDGVEVAGAEYYRVFAESYGTDVGMEAHLQAQEYPRFISRLQ